MIKYFKQHLGVRLFLSYLLVLLVGVAVIALAAGFGIAIAAFGGAMGQGKAIAAGLEGIARNPSAQNKIFIPMIVGLALIESLVIYALVIAFVLVGKL